MADGDGKEGERSWRYRWIKNRSRGWLVAAGFVTLVPHSISWRGLGSELGMSANQAATRNTRNFHILRGSGPGFDIDHGD